MPMYKWITLLFFVLLLNAASSQITYTLSGYVLDESNGETLIGATVFDVNNMSNGAQTNAYGFYSLTLPEGQYKIAVRYLGYQDQVFEINLNKDLELKVELNDGIFMEEVVVSADRDKEKENVQSTKMGTVELPVEQIKKLPALLGEVDVLKSIQLLPGVLSSGEGNSGFYVRGGGPDQNLVLLDEALVYNSGHMLGFFSVFNADAIKNTTLIKGGMPANYGGRLSSVVDVSMKEGNNKKFQVDGGVGLISSRLTVQGPIAKEKVSFLVSARRTYILDLVQPYLKGGRFEGTNYYFYDVNAKINAQLSSKDRLFLSGYFGRDRLIFNQPQRDFKFALPYGNSTATLRWNHLFSNKLFMNLTGVYNDYQFEFEGGQSDFAFQLFSGVRDYNLKLDFDYFPNPKHQIKWGVNATHHTLTPSTASAQSKDNDFKTDLKPKYAIESGVFIQDDWKMNDIVSVNFGVRYSNFTQVGPYESTLDGKKYDAFEPVKTYHGFEPRLSGKVGLSSTQSLKFGVTRTNQYVHLVSNSSSTLPTDVWSPSTERVKPQVGMQYALGYFQNFNDNMFETSVEVYYKKLNNQLDYSESTVTEVGVDEELKFITGEGRAYGVELFLKKSKGRFNGWIGYTLSKSELNFDEINDGEWYPAVYDRPHDVSVVMNYAISKKWDVSAVFIYGTGQAYTPLSGIYPIEGEFNLFYGPRNSARLQDYHRADISATYTPKPDVKKAFSGSWTFSLFNLYNRKNPFFIYFENDPSSTVFNPKLNGKKISLFPIIPSISYNFKWKQK